MAFNRKHTEEEKKKMSEVMKLRYKNPDERRKTSMTTKRFYDNYECPASLREKRRQRMIEYNKTHEPIRYWKGKKLSKEHRDKLSGENANNWQGGKSLANEILRHNAEYKEWRAAVFERDDYTCVQCGAVGVELNADHIKPFAYFPELRLELSNGRTLCKPCHKDTITYGSRVNPMKDQLGGVA